MDCFGEVQFPNTRSFCDDYEYIDSNERFDYKISLETDQIPNELQLFVCIESDELTKVLGDYFQTHRTTRPLFAFPELKLAVYDIGNSCAVCLFAPKLFMRIEAEVMHVLEPLIKVSNRIVCIKTHSIAFFRGSPDESQNESLIRTLIINGDSTSDDFEKLQLPNFIGGVCANVANNCAFNDKSCHFHVVYLRDFMKQFTLSEIEPVLHLLITSYNFPINVQELPKKILFNDNNLYI